MEEARPLRAPGLGSGIVPEFQQDGGPDPEAQRIGFPRDGREAERIAIEPGEASRSRTTRATLPTRYGAVSKRETGTFGEVHPLGQSRAHFLPGVSLSWVMLVLRSYKDGQPRLAGAGWMVAARSMSTPTSRPTHWPDAHGPGRQPKSVRTRPTWPGGPRLILVEREMEGQRERPARAPDRQGPDRLVVALPLVDEAGRLEACLVCALHGEPVLLRKGLVPLDVARPGAGEVDQHVGVSGLGLGRVEVDLGLEALEAPGERRPDLHTGELDGALAGSTAHSAAVAGTAAADRATARQKMRVFMARFQGPDRAEGARAGSMRRRTSSWMMKWWRRAAAPWRMSSAVSTPPRRRATA